MKRREPMLINIGGKQVTSKEIEKELSNHPSVVDCQCVGIPDPDGKKWGAVKAYVLLEKNLNNYPTPTDLKVFLKGKIEDWKIPLVIHIVDKIPCEQSLCSGNVTSRRVSDALQNKGTAQQPGVTWNEIYRNWVENETIWSIANNGTMYVGFGDSGKLWYGNDGFNWNAGDRFAGPCYGSAWGKDKFVAGGSKGYIYRSKNGIDWVEEKSGIETNIWDVAYIPDRNWFIAVAAQGWLSIGKNGGTQWHPVHIDAAGGLTLNAVDSGNGNIVVTGENGYVYTSKDGENWTKKKVSPTTLFCVTYSEINGKPTYVTGGRQGYIFTSHDLVTWKETTPPGFPGIFLFNIVHTGSLFVIAGEYNSQIPPIVAPVFTSPDGYNWTYRHSNAFNACVGLTYNHTLKRLHLTGAYMTMVYSDDTENQIKITSPTSTPGTVTQLNGGSTHKITWTTTGTIGKLEILYSVNGFQGPFVSITDNIAPELGSYSWTVADEESENCIIKIKEMTRSLAVYSTPVTIAHGVVVKDTLTITAPNGGEAFAPNSKCTVTWESTGDVGRVRLRYSIDGGENFTKFADNLPNNGSYTWTVPEVNSGNCLVRINEINSSGDPNDRSDAPFTIGNPSSSTITLISPNGGEVLAPDSEKTITWESSVIEGQVCLHYSTDGGKTFTVIADNLPNNGTYIWKVPNIDSTDCFVRINAINSTNEPYDVSDAPFTIGILPTLTITSPNGGEEIEPGSNYTVTWESTGEIGRVRLRYSTDGGETFIKFADNLVNNGVYEWTVPNVNSGNCLVRINEINSSGKPNDLSDAPFTIGEAIPRTLTVTTPNGGEVIEPGTKYMVTWESTGNVGRVRLRYSDDGGETFEKFADNLLNNGTYQWTVPDINSADCLVRINEINSSGEPNDISDGPFTIGEIIPKTLTLTTPNGGETLRPGSDYLVTWHSTGNVGDIRLLYSSDGGETFKTFADNLINNGAYTWPVPDIDSDHCLVKINEAKGSIEPNDTSDAPFTIRKEIPKTLTLTAPNGGEILKTDSEYTVTWNSTGNVGALQLLYSIDGGETFVGIADHVPNNGSYTWVIPDTDSAQCKVRIDASVDTGTLSDISNNEFTIKPLATITVTSPTGEDTPLPGRILRITWTSQSHTGTVSIAYSADDGSNWETIVRGTSDDGFYGWRIPGDFLGQCRIKISSIHYPSVFAISDSFTVAGPKTLVADPGQLTFRYVQQSIVPDPQTVNISNSGGGTLTWTSTSPVDWLKTNQHSGTGDATVTVTVDPTGLDVGTYTENISFSDPAAVNSPLQLPVELTVKKPFPSRLPFGAFDSPADSAVVYSSILISGWALDDRGIDSVKIYADGNFIGNAVLVEGARPDIIEKYPDYPGNHEAGWGYTMLTNFLPNGGNGEYTLKAVAIDIDGNKTELGTKTITVDNKNAVKPFGTLDTPPQGAIISGKKYINWGWALTPKPNTIPRNGSTIQVWVDGKPMGHPTYNIHRDDIARLFPGLKNSDGAVGYFHLDTTQLSNGVHTISWSVRDDAGNVDGIGSRYFKVQNPDDSGSDNSDT